MTDEEMKEAHVIFDKDNKTVTISKELYDELTENTVVLGQMLDAISEILEDYIGPSTKGN